MDPTDTNPIATPGTGVFTTPDALRAQRDYAKALMYGHVGDKNGGAQFPVVRSWTQGVSNMVNALMGGITNGNALRNEQGMYGAAAAKAIPQPQPQAAAPSFPQALAFRGNDNEDADSSREADAIASIESKGSGDYSAEGPVTKSGDRAYGRYQVMGANIPAWTKEVLGKSMTPKEFEADPVAQDRVFRVKFNQGGDNDTDRASVWFTGKPYAQGAGRSDGYINGAQYVDRFNKAMGGPSASPSAGMPTAAPSPMAFAGSTEGTSEEPAVQAINSSAPMQQVAAGRTPAPGVAKPMPTPNGSGIYVDPALVQRRPQYTPEQIRSLMANPFLSEQARLGFLQQFNQQNQPLEIPYPGGKVIVDPTNPTRQQFIPEGHWGVNKIDTIEQPSFQVPSGNGTVIQAPVVHPPAPPVGPQGAAAPAPAPGGGGATAVSQNAPAATPAASKPVQVASLDPAAAFSAGAKPVQPSPPVQTAGEMAFGRLAANDDAIKQLVGEDAWNAFQQKKNYDQQQLLKQKAGEAGIEVEKQRQEAPIEVEKDAKIGNNKLNAKRYEDQLGATQAAQSQLENLRTASRMMNDDNFYSGFAAEPIEGMKKLLAAIGGDPNSAAPMEVFRKTMASQIASSLKASYGGLGQIRNKEIELQEKSNGSLNSTPAANRALVEISRRNAERVLQIGEMAQQYRLGHDVLDPVTGKTLVPANTDKDGNVIQRVGLDPEYDAAVTKFVKSHQLFSDDEYNAWSNLFGKSGKEKEASEFPPGATDLLLKDPNLRDRFDEQFGKGASDKVIGPRKSTE